MTDDDILTAIDVVRRRDGACTYRSLADELDVSHSAARYRVLKLVDTGLVEVMGGRSGAVRRVEEDTRKGSSTPLLGHVTIEVAYDPILRKPLRVRIVDADGAVKKPD